MEQSISYYYSFIYKYVGSMGVTLYSTMKFLIAGQKAMSIAPLLKNFSKGSMLTLKD